MLGDKHTAYRTLQKHIRPIEDSLVIITKVSYCYVNESTGRIQLIPINLTSFNSKLTNFAVIVNSKLQTEKNLPYHCRSTSRQQKSVLT